MSSPISKRCTLLELSQASLHGHFSALCSYPFLLAYRNGIGMETGLSVSERSALQGMTSVVRKNEYLLGRGALKDILQALGKSTDTAALQWPSGFCSLSHSHGHAVAVGLPSDSGIGVDLQLNRTPAAQMADRILSEDTLAYWNLAEEDEKASMLQRFWTVNEAVYKASAAPQPAYFRHYRMDDPASLDSTVRIQGIDCRYRVQSAQVPGGYISLAWRLE